MFEHGFSRNKNLIQSQIKEVNEQYSKVTAVETAFKNTAKDHTRNGSKEPSSEPPRAGFIPAAEVMAERKNSAIVAAKINSNRLKELEEKERKEAENKFERISAKSSNSAPKRDPKQILKAYKSTERKTDPKVVEVKIISVSAVKRIFPSNHTNSYNF